MGIFFDKAYHRGVPLGDAGSRQVAAYQIWKADPAVVNHQWH